MILTEEINTPCKSQQIDIASASISCESDLREQNKFLLRDSMKYSRNCTASDTLVFLCDLKEAYRHTLDRFTQRQEKLIRLLYMLHTFCRIQLAIV